MDTTGFVVSQVNQGSGPDNVVSGLSGLSGILIGMDSDGSIGQVGMATLRARPVRRSDEEPGQ